MTSEPRSSEGSFSRLNLGNFLVQCSLLAILGWHYFQGSWHSGPFMIAAVLQGLSFLVLLIMAARTVSGIPASWKGAVAGNAALLGLSILLSSPGGYLLGLWALDLLRTP